MKPDQERVRSLLIDTVTLLCKNGLSFKGSLKIQGLLGVTIDEDDIFIVQIDEKFANKEKMASVTCVEGNGAVIVSPLHGNDRRAHMDSPAYSTKRSGARIGTSSPSKKARKLGFENSKPQMMTDWAHEQDVPAVIKQELIMDDPGFYHMGEDADKPPTGISNIEISDEGDIDGDVGRPQLWATVGQTLVNTHPPSHTQPASGGQRKSKETFSTGAGPIPTKVEDDGGEWLEEQEGEMTDTWNDYPENLESESASCSSWRKDRTPGGSSQRASRSSSDREFVCQYEGCDKAFFRKDHLIRHQRSMHGKPYGVTFQTQYTCHVKDCQKVFYRTQTLTKHMFDIHGELVNDVV